MEFLYASLCECDTYHLSVGMPDGDTECTCGLSVDRLDFIPIKPLYLATEEELSAITGRLAAVASGAVLAKV